MNRDPDIILGPHDAAIVVRANGECEVWLPVADGDDDVIEADDPAVRVTKLAIANNDPEVQELLNRKLYET